MYLSQKNRKEFKAAMKGDISKERHYKSQADRRYIRLIKNSEKYYQTSYRKITGNQLRRMISV